MKPDHPCLVEPRRSIHEAISFVHDCHVAGMEGAAEGPRGRVAASPSFRAAQAEFARLLGEPGREEWETLMSVAARAATRGQAFTLVVCHRFSPLVSTAAMSTQPVGIGWERVLHGRLTFHDFPRLTAQASRLGKARWACLDARLAGAIQPLYGPDFADLVRRRQVRWVIIDRALARVEVRQLRRLSLNLGFTALCPRERGRARNPGS